MSGEMEKPIWAKWRIAEAERIDVIATYREGDGFVRREISFEHVDEAARAFGPSFREVVEKVRSEGGRAGRWRP